MFRSVLSLWCISSRTGSEPSMVSKMHHVETDGAEEEPVVDPEDIIVSPEEARVLFDEAARSIMGRSGEEFVQRWDAGEYDEIADTAGHRHIIELALMIPLWRGSF